MHRWRRRSARQRHHGAALVLREQMPPRPSPSRRIRANVAGKRALGERHGQPAVRDVLRRTQQPLGRSAPAAAFASRTSACEVEARERSRRRRTRRAAARGLAEQHDRCAWRESRSATASATSSSRPTMPTLGVGGIGSAGGLVVEADVAAHDRHVERATRLGQAVDRLGQLPGDQPASRDCRSSGSRSRRSARRPRTPGCAPPRRPPAARRGAGRAACSADCSRW